MPTTRLTPHETWESNSMRSRRSIDVIHYALDDRGNPLKLFDNHPVLPGYQFIILIFIQFKLERNNTIEK